MLQSLRSLTIAFIIVFMIATVGTGIASYMATHLTIRDLVDKRIAEASYSVERAGRDATANRMLARIDDLASQRETGDLGFLLLAPDGKRLGGNIDLRRVPALGYSTLSASDQLEGLSAGRALTRRLPGGLTLVTVGETEPFDDYNASRLRIYVIGFGSIVAVVLGGLTLFGVLIASRIEAIRRTADAIVDGDMRRRVPVQGADGAFDRQARAFNRMLDRVTDLMHGISNVSNDIAHELRTPLARLRSQLTLIAEETDDAARRDRVAAAVEQCDRLLATFAAILRIAEVEGGDRRAGFEAIDLGGLARDVATMMAPVVDESGRSLALGACPSIRISGDRQLLTQLLLNLIQNGLRHTPPGARIAIDVARSGDQARLQVVDNGPGIAAAQRDLALRRFGRVGTGTVRGHGLGLSLVEAIVRLHRGRMDLSDAAPGLAVTILIPALAGAANG